MNYITEPPYGRYIAAKELLNLCTFKYTCFVAQYINSFAAYCKCKCNYNTRVITITFLMCTVVSYSRSKIFMIKNFISHIISNTLYTYICDQICKKGSYTRTTSIHRFCHHSIATLMNNPCMCE